MSYHRPRPGRRFRYSGRICHCLRCGYDWQARWEDRPWRCARCRSVYWATPQGVPLEEDDAGDVLEPEDGGDDDSEDIEGGRP